ncbi:rhamnogalacturonyl hydrolase YesR [Pedobacter sp. AK017]|uniref:glycoside hydrolase family 88/105 protein n=1 Tax=Pedobacter sp. AK017 TaxID=2723073 RepID=UPI001615B1A2|nr:glycoside hydrolase family 88 protein [Pedobacter sp. AK017]MBB5439012.1 rhamnogalacturonyl hydrolase YesR [Pedobacter sp. AK017]
MMKTKGIFLLILNLVLSFGFYKCYGQSSRPAIMETMKKVARWQVDSIKQHGWRHAEDDWTNGTLYTGLMAYAQASGNRSYIDFLRKEVGEKLNWQITKDSLRYFADFYCVGQLYTELYLLDKQPRTIKDFRQLADTLLARPHTESLEWINKINRREWAWCDALFMGPPALALLAKATGNTQYLDLSNKLWWKTTAYLYDKEEHLFYRDSRFFDRKEANGKKVFWARGNGWVMGGMARLLDNMPANYPDRPKYIQLFKEMAGKIKTLQQADGSWRTSLLDPESYPSKETSGTAFYCYALAWGINHKILDAKTYLPVVWKAWHALTTSITATGMLGNVQPIGNKAKAEIKADDTEVYAIGGFLLAGTELMNTSPIPR